MDLAKAARDPWVWGQLVLMLVVAAGAPLLPRTLSLGPLDPVLTRIDPSWIRWLGGAVLAAGLAIGVWGARSLGPSLTPGTEPLPRAALVTEGAYAYVRHPIYLGVVLALTGYTVAWSNWTLGLVFGAIALMYFEGKAGAEERWLGARYPAYAAYLRRVRVKILAPGS